MPQTSDNQRIRKGLKFLTEADKAIIRASAPLERLTGITNPPKVKDLLAWYPFLVAGNDYQGRMTQEQAEYLKKYTADLKTFADAISRILILSNDMVVHALNDLAGGLDSPEKVVKVAGTTVPAVGCCYYDTGMESGNMTKSYCEAGLQGTWDTNPCRATPEDQVEGEPDQDGVEAAG